MPESWSTRLSRWKFNWFPAYRGSGGRIEYIASDWTEVRVRLPLTWRTRNYVGTIFGGSIYSAVDPFYMIMLIERLGPGYVVWDKSGTIRFRRPGRGTVRARFEIPPERVEEIRRAVDTSGRTEPTFSVSILDAGGEVVAEVEKLLSVRRRT